MSKQTAVNWLIDQIKNEDYHTEGELGNSCIDVNTLLMLCEQAKQMEKEQIIDACWEGGQGNINQCEDYYNETYGSKGSDDVTKCDTKISQTEMSDEEIEKIANEEYDADKKYNFTYNIYDLINHYKQGMKKYREQLKKKDNE